MEIEEFAERLSTLRQEKGVSARDMSRSIGQNENYINNIENKKAFPSMTSFFYICEFFKNYARSLFRGAKSKSISYTANRKRFNEAKFGSARAYCFYCKGNSQ